MRATTARVWVWCVALMCAGASGPDMAYDRSFVQIDMNEVRHVACL